MHWVRVTRVNDDYFYHQLKQGRKKIAEILTKKDGSPCSWNKGKYKAIGFMWSLTAETLEKCKELAEQEALKGM